MASFTIVHHSDEEGLLTLLDIIDNPILEYRDVRHISPEHNVDTVIYLREIEPDICDLLRWANRCRRDVFVCTSDVKPRNVTSDFHIQLEDLRSNALAKELLFEILSGNVDPDYKGPRLILSSGGLTSEFFAAAKGKLLELIESGSVRRIAVQQGLYDQIKLAKDIPGGRFKQLGDYNLARYVKGATSRFDKSLVKLRVDFTGSENTTAPVQQSSATKLLLDARAGNLVVLLGIPGSGKSVQLQAIDENFALDAIRTDASDPITCFCVTLGEHASGDREIAPLDWLKKKWENRFDKESGISFASSLKERRLVFLLDGFNEIPFSNSEERRKWMLRWRACIHDDLLIHPRVKVVVACRSRDNQINFGSEDNPATTATLAPLDRASILDMARRSSFAGYLKLKEAFEHDSSLEYLYRTPYTLHDFLEINKGPVPRTQSEVFWRRIASAVEREREIANPIIGGPWLPDDLVYELLNAKNSRSAVAALRSIPLFQALGALAFWMSDGGTDGGQHRSAVNLLEEFNLWLEKDGMFPQDIEIYQFRGLAEDFSIIIENEGYLKFSHQSLQDFFCVVGEPRQRILYQATLDSAEFESLLEPIDQALKSMVPGDVLQVVPSTGFEESLARLVEIDASAVPLAVNANPWLMAEIIGKDVDYYSDDVERLIGILEAKTSYEQDVRVRLASLWALGLIGWGGSRVSRLPSPEMVEIEGRTWRLGVTKAQARELNLSAYQRAKRKHVSTFSIGVYAVSNREFEVFRNADGYEQERFWSCDGWRWRCGHEPEGDVYSRWIERRNRVAADKLKPVRLLREGKASVVEAAAILRFAKMSDDEIAAYVKALVGKKVHAPAFWNVPRYNNPLQPVVGVSFFEAEAYCNWLSEETGSKYRLPNEAEWEAAALSCWVGEGGGDLAVGEITQPATWVEAWGNSAEMHLGRPSPMGALATGNTCNGAGPRDMAGNVFEWVTDRVNDDEDWCLVVKGGSFRHLMRRSHPGYRGRGDKTSRNDDNGFRLAVSN